MEAINRNIKKVLVIDDDPVSRELIAYIFKNAGCETKTATDGIDAMGILKKYRPDIITIDMIMPYINGDRLCRIIREMEHLRDVHMVIISSIPMEGDNDPKNLDADVCIAKGLPDFQKALIEQLKYIPKDVIKKTGKNFIRKDNTETKRITKELLAAQYRLNTIVHSIIEPLFELSMDGKIVFANQSAVLLVDIPEHQLLGSRFLDLFSGGSIKRIKAGLGSIQENNFEIIDDSPAQLSNGRYVTGRFIPLVVTSKKTYICILNDVTVRKQIEKDLAASKASFRDIVEKHGDGILVVDVKGDVQYANPTALSLLQRTEAELIGKKFGFPMIAGQFAEINIYRPKTGKHGTAELRMMETQWEDKPARLIALSDITERKELEENLKTAKQAAETANRAKSEFLTNMSHELRSPLNSLMLLAEDLASNRSETLDTSKVESAKIIHSSGKMLLGLISEILDLSKIEAGRMDIYVRPTNLEKLKNNIMGLYRHVAENKSIALNISLEKNLPDKIYTDHQKLEQIIRNLVSNAIKFTEEGRIEIRFRRPLNMETIPEKLHRPETIIITVSDTGIGIPKEMQSDVFNAFTQVDGSISRKYGGTGLGLSISKKLAILLGGDIELSGNPGKGSVFTLYLPERLKTTGNVREDRRLKRREEIKCHCDAVSGTGVPDDKFNSRLHKLKNKNILVVDDEARNLFALKKIMSRYGINVFKAIRGEKALSFLQKEPDMDLILMDIMMPDMDGYETIDKIRKIESCEKIPIIALTAKTEDGERAKCLNAGADDYLSKPVEIDRLFTIISRML